MTLPPSQIKNKFLIGIISDTHGRLNSATLEVFTDVDLIIHAGDIGAPEILDALGQAAPVAAVRGNMDGGSWTNDLPDSRGVKVGDVRLFVLHDLGKLDLDPQAGGFNAVISGHTHRPAITAQNGVLYLNPGSVTYPGHRRQATVALLRINGEKLSAHIVEVGG